MGKLLLVARREYLAYVTAWGFWLGLLFTPLILALAMGLPLLIEKTQPARYYTVLETGTTFSDHLTEYLNDRRAREIERLLSPVSGLSEDADASERLKEFRSLRAQGTALEAAVQQVAPELVPAIPAHDFVEVPRPAQSIDDLMAYLTGEKLVSGPLGARELYAVFIVGNDQIEYWSDDVVSTDFSRMGMRVSEQMALRNMFDAEGFDERLIAETRANALEIELRSPSAQSETGQIAFSDQAPFFMAIGLSFLLWLLIFSVVNYLLTGTIEERSNKIFDALLTSVSLPQLLTGKLLGVLFLSLTLVSVWACSSLIFSLALQDALPPEISQALAEALNPRLLAPAIISFFLGYLMYGAMFLALGSLCDTIQEAQSLLSPVFIVMMIPLLMIPVAISNPGSPLLEGLAWFPLLTPFLLILQVPNDPPVWQVLVQILWMGLFTTGVLWAATRVYRAGAVHGAGLTEARGWMMGLIGRKKAASAPGSEAGDR